MGIYIIVPKENMLKQCFEKTTLVSYGDLLGGVGYLGNHHHVITKPTV